MRVEGERRRGGEMLRISQRMTKRGRKAYIISIDLVERKL